MFASSELDYHLRSKWGLSPSMAGILSGMGGGLAQAYTTMGFCTFMKTVEVTRHKQTGVHVSTLKIAQDVLKREGIVGINKGVSAVALRQMTNWGSRFGTMSVLFLYLITRIIIKAFRGSPRWLCEARTRNGS